MAGWRFIDVSHAIEPGMKTYPGLPEPRAETIVDYETSRERYQGKAEFFTKLLGAGIPICEHMTSLEAVPSAGGHLHAVPIAWVGGVTFPVRPT